jgi:hypothetical protein
LRAGQAIRNNGEEGNRPERRTVIRNVYDKVELATGSHDRKLCVLDLQEFRAKSDGLQILAEATGRDLGWELTLDAWLADSSR